MQKMHLRKENAVLIKEGQDSSVITSADICSELELLFCKHETGIAEMMWKYRTTMYVRRRRTRKECLYCLSFTYRMLTIICSYFLQTVSAT